MIKHFCSEASELLESAEEALLALEKEPSSKEHISKAFRALHSLKGNAGFFGYSDLEVLSHQAETALDNIQEGESPASVKTFSLLLEVIDFLRNALTSLENGKSPAIPALSGIINLLSDNIKSKIPPDDSVKEHRVSHSPIVDHHPPEHLEVEQDEITTLIDLDKRKTQDRRSTSDRRTEVPTESEDNRRENEDRRSASDRRSLFNSQRQSIRVDIEKLDALLDLVGELVIAEAMVAQNPELKSLNQDLPEFEKSISHLDKITRELHDIATSIRMIPLSGTFRRMIRLVRDLAQKAGKKVTLDIIGEETEVDRTVIEHINDPLVHAIRNAVDHGIGTPEERLKQGKKCCRHNKVGSEICGWRSLDTS